MNKTIDTRPIMVSIRCATYNHAPYIRQCLDGFVMQKTNFRFEAIVHDDASTDGTTEIVREYAEKYPDIIKPMYEKENQYSRNLPAMNDAINERLVGKYVAICEGDDYWTAPQKLQNQFDYLEEHPECSMCFHPHYNLLPNGKMLQHIPRLKKEYYSVTDFILRGEEFISTNSMFFLRKHYLRNSEKPEFWKASPAGDWPLTLYLAINGKVGYINEIMSVYRINSVGSWTMINNGSSQKMAHIIQKTFLSINLFNKYTDGKYRFAIAIKKIRIKIRYYRRIIGV